MSHVLVDYLLLPVGRGCNAVEVMSHVFSASETSTTRLTTAQRGLAQGHSLGGRIVFNSGCFYIPKEYHVLPVMVDVRTNL
jgi:hypothetical protein